MSNSTTTRDWRFTVKLTGVAIAMGLAGGCLARSEASLAIMGAGGFVAGLVMFFAVVALDRIYPAC